MTSAFSWQNSVSLCPTSFCTPSQACLLLRVSLDFLLLHSSPLWWKGHPFWVLVLKGLVGFHRTVQLQFFQHYWLGHILGLLWYWIVCLGNRDHSVIFEFAPKYCISDSFVDYEGCSISSKGFLPTLSRVQLFMTLWTIRSMEFSRLEYWSG